MRYGHDCARDVLEADSGGNKDVICRVVCRTRGWPGRGRRRLGGNKNVENDVNDMPLRILVVKRVERINT